MNHPKEKLYFILGSDAAINIKTWKNYELLPNLTNFLIALRSEDNIDVLENDFPFNYEIISGDKLDLSSTTDSHLDLTTEFTKLKTFINDEEDVELAQAKIGEISTKLSEVSQELQNKISKISIEEREYAQNLAKNLQLYIFHFCRTQN